MARESQLWVRGVSMDAWLRWITCGSAIAAALLLAWPGVAQAWSRRCSWNTDPETILVIPVYVSCPSFEPFGFDCDEVTRGTVQMVRPWNNVGINVRFSVLKSMLTEGENPAGTVLVHAQTAHGMNTGFKAAASAGAADQDCGVNPAEIEFYMNYVWSLDYSIGRYNTSPTPIPSDGEQLDMIGVGIHEFGHVLGFHHSGDPAGSCGGVPTTQNSLMTAGRERSSHSLYHDELLGMGGPCPYHWFAETPLVVAASSDGGDSWNPDIVHVDGPAGGSDIAASDTTGTHVIASTFQWGLRIFRGDGAGSWEIVSPLVGWTVIDGPAVAWGEEAFVIAYATTGSAGSSSTADGNRLILSISEDDGYTWETLETEHRTSFRPGIAWDPRSKRFVVAYAVGWDPTTSLCERCGQLAVFEIDPASGFSFPQPGQLGHGLFAGRFASEGPGIACPDNNIVTWDPVSGAYVSNRRACWVIFPDRSYPMGPLRHSVLVRRDQLVPPQVPNPMNTSWWVETTSSAYPAWGSYYLASSRAVAVAWDPSRDAVVYGLRDEGAPLEGIAGWQPADGTVPHPNWQAGGTGFDSGGPFAATLRSAPGLTVDRSGAEVVLRAVASAASF